MTGGLVRPARVVGRRPPCLPARAKPAKHLARRGVPDRAS
ncbi:hypothetical protein C7S16_4738 [Burkholderia thailandensis]|uniref:Uncharacterized protein n=1 Tax=Burkholderia thailandensis TaxID=57975 RepID=A0AAW9CIP2_BURTH|nr:hypothetical protein [Burkholderia thailandensis]MDW9250825.1 hypothetical protein [Burkholderia thailandensis]